MLSFMHIVILRPANTRVHFIICTQKKMGKLKLGILYLFWYRNYSQPFHFDVSKSWSKGSTMKISALFRLIIFSTLGENSRKGIVFGSHSRGLSSIFRPCSNLNYIRLKTTLQRLRKVKSPSTVTRICFLLFWIACFRTFKVLIGKVGTRRRST